jgi:hypothetical protein
MGFRGESEGVALSSESTRPRAGVATLPSDGEVNVVADSPYPH